MQTSISIITWLAPLLWIGLSFVPLVEDPNQAKSILKASQSWIELFQKNYHRLPQHLGEIRALARSSGFDFTPYDSYAQRLHYLPLTDRDFIIKSFGADQQENTMNSAVDNSLSTLPPHASTSVATTDLDESLPQLYQPAILSGAATANSEAIASVVIHNEFHSKQLLVRKPSDDSFFMLAFHDKVEEFLWLPSGYEIIFTANGSQRYEDGIFYWNLADNSIHNILPDLKRQFWPLAKEEDRYYFSLSHISQAQNLIYILITQNKSPSLDPKIFYSFKNLAAIAINSNLGSQPQVTRIPTDFTYSAFDYPISQQRSILTFNKASSDQQAWLNLSLGGDAENLIDQWQSFSSSQAKSPIFSYSLWWLASIYNDALRSMIEEQSDQTPVMRNFALEITEALCKLPAAPSYLKAMGLHLKKNLLLSKAADYNVTSFSTTQ